MFIIFDSALTNRKPSNISRSQDSLETMNAIQRLVSIVVVVLLCFQQSVSALPFAGSQLKSFRRDVISSSTRRSLAPLTQDLLSSCVAIGGATAWLQIWITLAKNGKIDTKLSRKIIHSGSAPLFMCLWPLYSSGDATSRVIASAVPLVQMVRLASAGITSAKKLMQDSDTGITPSSSGGSSSSSNTGITSDISGDNDLVNAISRSGSKSEALGGPLIYTVVLFLSTLLGFRESPVGVVAVCQMAAGDGLADIVGRRWGAVKWPFSASKSYAGSLAFVVGAFVVSTGVLSLLSATGCLSMNVGGYLPQLLFISVACALVELVPVWDDNITVPVAGAILTALLLR